jgi:hypothetical protein
LLKNKGKPSAYLYFCVYFASKHGYVIGKCQGIYVKQMVRFGLLGFTSIERLQHALKNQLPFNPSDFGEVIAAGTGEPSPETQAEVALQYPIIGKNAGATLGVPIESAATPIAKKAWDEY